MKNKILSAQQVAGLMGLDDSQVRRLLASGKIKGVKFGRAWMVKLKDLPLCRGCGERIEGKKRHWCDDCKLRF